MSIFAIIDYMLIQKCDFYYSTVFMFCFGYFISSETDKIKLLCIGISLLIILITISLPDFHYNILFESKEGYSCVLHDSLTIIFVLGLIILFNRFNIDYVSTLINWIGKYSFSIYIVHGLYCTGSPISVFKHNNNLFFAIILFLIITLISAIVLQNITDAIKRLLTRNNILK